MNRIEDLKVGMTVYFKGGNGYVSEGEETSENNDEKVTGFIFNGDTSKIYVSIEDIGIEIDWEKTRELNKDKGMKFTSCQNVDCNKELNCKEKELIDAVQKANLDGVIHGYVIDYHPNGIEMQVYQTQDILFFKYRSIEHDADHCLVLINSLYVNTNKEYDFNDLIDVAVKAVSGEIIEGYEVGKTDKGLYISFVCDFGMSVKYFKCDWREAVLFIQSLYTETFVIESEEDLKRVKVGSKITLLNEKVITVRAVGNYGVYFEEDNSIAGELILKGATVTQNRSL